MTQLARSNILVTSAGRRVSLVRFFKAALSSLGLSGRVFTADVAPEWAAACHESDGAFCLPPVGDPEHLPALRTLTEQHDIGLVVPTIDTELEALAQSQDDLGSAGAHVVVSSEALVKTSADKRASSRWFSDLGFEVPIPIPRDRLTFPCFAKPFDGSLSRGAQALLGPEHLCDAVRNDPSMLFMEYCSPERYDEYTVDCYFDRSGALKCLVPRRRVEVRGGEVSKGVAEKGLNDGLYSFLWSRLSRVHDARGCLTFQFFVEIGGARVVASECNPRFGGGFPLSWHAGAHMPTWLIREYLLGETIAEYHDWENGMAMVRYDEEVVLTPETRGRLQI